MFGFYLGQNFNFSYIIYGKTLSAKDSCNFFWSVLSVEILWLIWKKWNNNIFAGVSRNLTGSLWRLIDHKNSIKVTLVLNIDEKNFVDLLSDGANVKLSPFFMHPIDGL